VIQRRPKARRAGRKGGASATAAGVCAALRRVLPDAPASAVVPSARLLEDLGLDSLKIAELSLALEDELGRPLFLGELFATAVNPERLRVADLIGFLDTQA
jgi:acyl carrier protein